jgi:hypothetical protein
MTVAADMYEALAPVAWDDANQGYALLHYVTAYSMGLETPDLYVRDTPELGLPGWGILLDVDNAPAEALGWLGQFVGVTLIPGQTEDEHRVRISNTDGFKRGKPSSIRSAAAKHLTGTKTVIFRERYDITDPLVDSPGHLTIFTFAPETPDAALVEAAILEQKPAGIILHYEVRDGMDWATLVADTPLWSDVVTDYTSWADVADTY